MKMWLATLLLFTNLSLASQDTEFLTDEEHLFWFDIDSLTTLKLSFSEAAWQQLLQSQQRQRYEVSAFISYTKGTQTVGLSNIGVKIGGNTSFQLPESSNGDLQQAHFTMDFDEFVDDQTLKGLSSLKLKRFHADSTFVHEPLSNQIMHNFGVFTVHSSVYVKLELQIGEQAPQYWGMYRLNEHVNRKEFLTKRFGDNNDDGFLWQGNYKDWGPAHFSRITANWGGIADDDYASFEYKGKGSRFEEGREQLVRLATNFTQLEGQEFIDYVERHINIPLFLKGLASEAILGHWDGFWGNGNNYFFYIDEQEVLHFMPYDTDNALGTSLLLGDVGESDPLIFGNSYNPPLLVTKILSHPEFFEQYQSYCRELVTLSNLMTEAYSTAWIDKVHALIENDLQNVTGDNQQIIDRPASWGNEPSYRLFDLNSGKNWYQTRLEAVELALGESLTPQPIDDSTDEQDDGDTDQQSEDNTAQEVSDETENSVSSGGGAIGMPLFYLLGLAALFIRNRKTKRSQF